MESVSGAVYVREAKKGRRRRQVDGFMMTILSDVLH